MGEGERKPVSCDMLREQGKGRGHWEEDYWQSPASRDRKTPSRAGVGLRAGLAHRQPWLQSPAV